MRCFILPQICYFALHACTCVCFSQNEDELDRSNEMITFQQACSNIVESEEQLMEDLYTLIQVCVCVHTGLCVRACV